MNDPEFNNGREDEVHERSKRFIKLVTNQDFETTSAWTTLSSDSSSSVDVNPARLLMLSLAMITAALLISLQRFMASNLQSNGGKN